MRDALSNGQAFRTFSVVDNFNRQALAIEVATSLPSRKVTTCLDQIAVWRGYPQRLRLDNGSEFIARYFKDWAKQHGLLLDFTAPGCPYQNAYVERFNRTFREDVLDATWFDSLQEAQDLADQWRHLYNEHRPHDALGGLTPLDFLAHASPPSLLSTGSI
jgi:putative transposase